MNRYFIAIVLVCAAAAVLLVISGTRTGTAAVLLPSELASDTRAAGGRVRVAGKVIGDSIEYRVEPAALLHFAIRDPDRELGNLKVRYEGIKPDMFAAGRDVVVEGRYRGGVLEASNLLTQCPSKYEPPDPAARNYGQQ